MNLVSRLKGASGTATDTEHPSQRHFEFSDDEQDEEDNYYDVPSLSSSDILTTAVEDTPETTSQKGSPPPLPYKEQMEKELALLMQSEFGTEQEKIDKKMMSETSSHRPRYVPENPINVRVTYKRTNTSDQKQHHQQEQESLEHVQNLLLHLCEE
ncbi:hypothetical protein BDF14DRAFT_1758472 [Spinellus fusiger]|nr:hypothetical protein BDF14DRAFT_1758472 [Spinellus fusiger]